MVKKTCTLCGNEKSLDEFDEKKDGKYKKASRCKACQKLLRLDKKEIANKRAKDYYNNNKAKVLITCKIYRDSHLSEIKNYKRNWQIANKDKINNRHKVWTKEKRKNNFDFKIKSNIETLFRLSLKKQNIKKEKNLSEYTGLSIENYIVHLKKSQLNNLYLEKNIIHIDHIIPCSAYDFNDIEEIKKCWQPENLRLISESENKSKWCKIDYDLIKNYNIEHLLPKNYNNDSSKKSMNKS